MEKFCDMDWIWSFRLSSNLRHFSSSVTSISGAYLLNHVILSYIRLHLIAFVSDYETLIAYYLNRGDPHNASSTHPRRTSM